MLTRLTCEHGAVAALDVCEILEQCNQACLVHGYGYAVVCWVPQHRLRGYANSKWHQGMFAAARLAGS